VPHKRAKEIKVDDIVWGSAGWWRVTKIYQNFGGRPGEYAFDTEHLETKAVGSMVGPAMMRLLVK